MKPSQLPNASTLEARLTTIRGSMTRAGANARAVAALTDNPGCARRRVIDAAGIRAHDLAERLGHAVTRGQSPFAIATGVRFENRLKTESDYQLLADALRPFVDLPKEGLVMVDLGRVPGTPGVEWLTKRARATDKVLRAIAQGSHDAPHLVDHPVLTFDVAGAPVFLEPDALAFRVGSRLELVEIKSYAIIDDQADPSKLASTAGQCAVYVLALRAAFERLGIDPALVCESVILVAPKNFGRQPVAHRIPLRKKVMALQRVLGAAPRAERLLELVPENFTLDVDPHGALPGAQRQAALKKEVRRLPKLYAPDCLASCDMARACRDEARTDGDPCMLGRSARDNLAGVRSLETALRLARGQGPCDDPALEPVAEGLRLAHGALQRARVRAGLETTSDSTSSRGVQR